MISASIGGALSSGIEGGVSPAGLEISPENRRIGHRPSWPTVELTEKLPFRNIYCPLRLAVCQIGFYGKRRGAGVIRVHGEPRQKAFWNANSVRN